MGIHDPVVFQKNIYRKFPKQISNAKAFFTAFIFLTTPVIFCICDFTMDCGSVRKSSILQWIVGLSENRQYLVEENVFLPQHYYIVIFVIYSLGTSGCGR